MGNKTGVMAAIAQALAQSFGYISERRQRERDRQAAIDEDEQVYTRRRADAQADAAERHQWDMDEITRRDELARTARAEERDLAEHETRRARGDEWLGMLRRSVELPERTRRPFIASNGRMTLRADDFLSDEELTAQQQAEAKAKLRQVGDEAYAREAGQRRAAQAYPTPVTAQGDDAGLPLGVKKYLSEIAQRHMNDPDGARQELTNAMQLLYADHPRLDAQRAVKHLETLTGAKPKEDDAAFMYGGGAGAPSPVTPAAPPARMGGAGPAGQPAAATPPISLPTAAPGGMTVAQEAEQLLAQLKVESDTAKREQMKARLATLRRQLAGVANKF